MLKRLSPSACLIALFALPFLLSAAHAGQLNRVTEAVDAAQGRALPGHLPRWSSSSNDLGVIADVQLDHLTVVLARSAAQQAAFEQFLDDQQNPASPNYHHWLTPQQVGVQFGLTDHDIAAVTGWLTGQGLRVDAVSPDRTRITFSGPSGNVARALGTQFHRYQVAVGSAQQQRISIARAPVVPAALAAVIAGFHGLSEERLQSQSHIDPIQGTLPQSASGITPQYTSSTGSHYLTPNDFATIFDINPVYNSGVNGSGVKVAIIGRSRINTPDITAYQTLMGLSTSALPVVIIPPTGLDPGIASDQGEQTLDVNRVMGTAPGAGADLVISGDSTTIDGLTVAMQHEVNTLVDPIMTISYGSCEVGASAAVTYYNSLFSAAAAEGITTFVSSGDSAASGCASDGVLPVASTQVLAINFLCSSPYVTCVGGTELNDSASPASYWSTTNSSSLASALHYVPEGAWNEPLSSTNSYQVLGTGGGPSIYLTKPSWQTGVGVPADGVRDTPDLSLPSAGHDGYFTCYQNSCAGGHFYAFFGTSAAAPSMAGIMAMVVQKLGHAQGNFNPTIYRLAASTALGVFHDASPASMSVSTCTAATAGMCNNSTPSTTALTGGLAGYPLTTGYDLATGWGSVDVANLITGVSSNFIVSSGSAFAVSAGSTATSSFTITSQNAFAGAVTLTCALTGFPSTASNIAPTCSIAPSSVTLTSGSSATVTLTIGTTVRHAAASPATAGFTALGAFTCLLLLAMPLALRKRLPAILPLILLAAGLTALSGCGGSGSGGGSAAATGTNPGAYQATVTGASGSYTASGTVIFTVN
ncbi:MAG: S53 family peptidase [Acidobacteriaceae bacterium]|nr:S53 family peptidase [Acidobacteriaceae bacterium]